MSQPALESFAEACEARGPLHLGVQWPGQAAAVPQLLPPPFAIIGRDPRSGLRLDDALVSRRHAYLQVIGGRPFVVDLGSRTGLHGRGGRVEAGWLSQRDPVRIGPCWLRWLEDCPGDLAPAMPGFDPLAGCLPGQALPSVTLEFLHGRQDHPRWQVNRLLTLIGNTPACKVRLRGAEVSRYHCSLVWTARGAWVVDLLGRGGVRLNGVQVPFALLQDEDQLQVGEFVIRVYCDAASSDAVRAGRQLVRPVAPRPTLVPAAPPTAATRPTAGAMEAVESPVPRGELVESLLLPVISQFGAMQEQMADQFRQTLMMMFQMFSALHKDQMGFIQEEMDRLQLLTKELHNLQIETARHPPAALPVRAEPPAAGPAANGAPVPAAPTPGAATGTHARGPLPGPAAPVRAANPLAPTPGASEPSAAAPAGTDIHAWLCQRMAAVQEERQSRWQKLLGLLGGKRPEAN